MRRAELLVLLFVASTSCSILPTRSPGGGRCVDNSDCATGQVCDPATAYCVCSGSSCHDAGAGGGVGSSGGSGGAAGAGAAGAAGQGMGGGAGLRDAGQDINPCNACGGSTPVCLNSSCVECATSADCTAAVTSPICDPTSHTCGACTTDAQCVAKLGATGNPGVCRSEIDGHCATDAETVYVQNTTGCMTTYVLNGGGGTATVPYCSLEPVSGAASSTKTLVVIRGTVAAPDWTFQRAQGAAATTFVGQQSAVIASATTPGFNLGSGVVYLRDLKLSSSASICIEATGGTLNLDNVMVNSCAGGGVLLNGAAFDVENATVMGNGPGTFMGLTTWGGILVNNPPSAGPTTFKLVTVENNTGGGVACSTSITGTSGVLVSGNSQGVDVGTTCGFSSCGSASATCGAQ